MSERDAVIVLNNELQFMSGRTAPPTAHTPDSTP